MVMFESLACGVPFIGTHVGGIPEIVNSEEIGRIANPGDSEGLAREIVKALSRDWNRLRIREYVSQYTWTEIARRTKEVYDAIINS